MSEFKGDSLSMPSETSPNQPDDVVKEWRELYQWAEDQLEALNASETLETKPRLRMFRKGSHLLLQGLKKIVTRKSVSTMEPQEETAHSPVIKEWRELYQWAEDQLEAIDPTFIANEESLSPEELFTKGLGLILGSFNPGEKRKVK